jgi:hypothetical protein
MKVVSISLFVFGFFALATAAAEWRRTMDNTPHLPGNHTFDGSTLAVGVKRRSAQTRRNVAITLWLIGFIAFF